MHQQDCNFCSSLKCYERGFQRSGEGTFLPAATDKLVALYKLKTGEVNLGGNPPFKIPFSRELQLWECPQCGTFYLYRTDYEFFWGGTEDEQILERLTDEQALACLENLEPTEIIPALPLPPQLTPEEIAFKALEENKRYICKRLEAALASSDYEEMTDALQKLDDGTYNYPELIPVLEIIARAKFYNFDDNGAGGFPRPDTSIKFSLKTEALRAIESIKKNPRL